MTAAPRAAAVALACGVLLGGCLWGPRWDKYDDSIRGTNDLPSRVAFGQRIGPDGDGCWAEDRERGGTVYCDLISIGGLHWDSGEVEVNRSGDIDIGAGFVCLTDREGKPWCWEWSPDIAPRPARVPEGETFKDVRVVDNHFDKVPGAPGFACGESLDLRRVVCWSVGTDQPDYRQANHRATDGHEWVIERIHEDPPRIKVARVAPPWVGDPPRQDYSDRTGGDQGVIHAFTGEPVRPGSLTPPWHWATETIP